MAKYISRAAFAAAALALGVSGAYATLYGTGTLHVSVTVMPTCNITSIDSLVFDTIGKDAATTEADVKPANIAVSCNNGGWHLSIPDSNVTRSMTYGGASLNYKLCNPTPTSYAGCDPFNQGHQIAGSDLTGTVTIFGIMEGGVHPAKSGVYSDTVTIELTS